MRRRLFQTLSLSFVFSAIGLAWVIYRVGKPEDLLSIKLLPFWSLALAVLTLLLSFLFAALRLQFLCRQFKKNLKFHHALRTHILSMFSAAITPGGSGGMPAIALSLQYQGLTAAQSLAVGMSIFKADATFHAWGMPIALIALFILKLYPQSIVWHVLGLVTIGIAIAVAYLVQFKMNWLESISRFVLRGPLLRFRKRGLRFIDSLLQADTILSTSSLRSFGIIQTLTLLSWLSFFSILFFFARGLRIPINFWAAQASQMVITVMSTFIPTPGGSGFFELGLSYPLIAKGGKNAVPAVILLWRLLTYYSVFILGPLLGGYILLKKLQAPSLDQSLSS